MFRSCPDTVIPRLEEQIWLPELKQMLVKLLCLFYDLSLFSPFFAVQASCGS